MIDDETKELAERFFQTGCENLFSDGEILNTFFIMEDTGKLNIIGAPWTTDDQKHMLSNQASLVAKDVNAPWVMFIGEMWIASVDPNVDLALLQRASEQPNREEILCLIIMEPDGKCNVISGKIQRAVDGTPYVDKHMWNYGESESTVKMNLIPAWGIDPDIRQN